MKKISIQARILKRIFRHFIKPMLVNAGGVEDLKTASRGEGPLSRWLSRIIPQADEKIMIDHIYAEWLGNPDAKGALLYLHGGAFLVGSPKSHRGLVKTLLNPVHFERFRLITGWLHNTNSLPRLKTQKRPMTGCCKMAMRQRALQ